MGPNFRRAALSNLPYYRPVTRLTLVAQKWMSGDVPWPFHLGNALLMGAAALLTYAILRLPQMGVAPWLALAAAALFALHPLASSCVYPISSGRETLLPSAWTLAAVYAFLRGGGGWRAAAMVAFAGALFSKEAGLVTPLLFVLAITCRPFPRTRPAEARRRGCGATGRWPRSPPCSLPSDSSCSAAANMSPARSPGPSIRCCTRSKACLHPPLNWCTSRQWRSGFQQHGWRLG